MSDPNDNTTVTETEPPTTDDTRRISAPPALEPPPLIKGDWPAEEEEQTEPDEAPADEPVAGVEPHAGCFNLADSSDRARAAKAGAQAFFAAVFGPDAWIETSSVHQRVETLKWSHRLLDQIVDAPQE